MTKDHFSTPLTIIQDKLSGSRWKFHRLRAILFFTAIFIQNQSISGVNWFEHKQDFFNFLIDFLLSLQSSVDFKEQVYMSFLRKWNYDSAKNHSRLTNAMANYIPYLHFSDFKSTLTSGQQKNWVVLSPWSIHTFNLSLETRANAKRSKHTHSKSQRNAFFSNIRLLRITKRNQYSFCNACVRFIFNISCDFSSVPMQLLWLPVRLSRKWPQWRGIQ